MAGNEPVVQFTQPEPFHGSGPVHPGHVPFIFRHQQVNSRTGPHFAAASQAGVPVLLRTREAGTAAQTQAQGILSGDGIPCQPDKQFTEVFFREAFSENFQKLHMNGLHGPQCSFRHLFQLRAAETNLLNQQGLPVEVQVPEGIPTGPV